QVSVQYYNSTTNAWYHSCSGTLIAPQWVLTSGSCAKQTYYLRVVLGKHNIYQQEAGASVAEVYLTAYHSGFNYTSSDDGPEVVDNSSNPPGAPTFILSACNPVPTLFAPVNCGWQIRGWRAVAPLRTFVTLHNAVMRFHHIIMRYRVWCSFSWNAAFLKNLLICCESVLEIMCPSCTGDWGGPLLCRKSDNSWAVHGVVTFISAVNCKNYYKPPVFSRISAYIPWIQNVSCTF
uniref:Peptidase S1 domain-containing protein n=1 Tax=Petromyzon marinus TaxID=7757 RepID=S4RGB5_PETMA